MPKSFSLQVGFQGYVAVDEGTTLVDIAARMHPAYKGSGGFRLLDKEACRQVEQLFPKATHHAWAAQWGPLYQQWQKTPSTQPSWRLLFKTVRYLHFV